MERMIRRVLRAALLDRDFFKEVESDPSLNQEALIVVVIVSAAGGVAAFLSGLMAKQISTAVLGLFVSTATGVANYYIWSYVTFYIGTNMFKGQADHGELLRVLGYASGPRLLSLLGFIPCLGLPVIFIGFIWSLIAGFFGVQEALDLDTTETLVTVAVGWIAILIVTGVVTSILG
jgi:hypothetical protein